MPNDNAPVNAPVSRANDRDYIKRVSAANEYWSNGGMRAPDERKVQALIRLAEDMNLDPTAYPQQVQLIGGKIPYVTATGFLTKLSNEGIRASFKRVPLTADEVTANFGIQPGVGTACCVMEGTFVRPNSEPVVVQCVGACDLKEKESKKRDREPEAPTTDKVAQMAETRARRRCIAVFFGANDCAEDAARFVEPEGEAPTAEAPRAEAAPAKPAPRLAAVKESAATAKSAPAKNQSKWARIQERLTQAGRTADLANLTWLALADCGCEPGEDMGLDEMRARVNGMDDAQFKSFAQAMKGHLDKPAATQQAA